MSGEVAELPGYPDGLASADIPSETQIISACDAYNAMTTDRPYRVAKGATLEGCAAAPAASSIRSSSAPSS